MVDSPCSTGSSAADQTLSESSDTDSDPEAASPAVNPTTVTDDYWVWAKAPYEIRSSQKTLGKWLVFKRFHKLDETWHMIRKAVESGELGATGAKSSTALEDASCYPMQPSTIRGVICVYTSEETMDEVGFKLVHMVKQDIRYKTDEATLQGRYIATGYKKVTIKTIFWNDGEPAFTKSLTRKRHGEPKRYPKALAPRVDPSRLPTEPPYTVYLGNLSYECTEDDVQEFFESRNMNVVSVRLPVERGTNRPRGFGYAELENTQALMEALSLSGEPLRGRRLYVDTPDAAQIAGWRPRMRGGERNPSQDSQGSYHYHARRGYDQYGDHGPQRYDEGRHYHDRYSDRGPPQRYDEGRHYHDPYGDRGPPRRYDEGRHYHDPYGDRGPPRRYDEGRHYHDPYGDHGPPQRYERGRHYHDPYGSDGYHPQRRSLEGHREQDRRNELPKERPRLQLQPRTKPLGDTSSGRERGEEGRASSSIFGQAKPVDTAAREREIEERLLKEREEDRGEREKRGGKSLTDEGGRRGERRNEASSQRGDRRGRYNSTGGGERGGRGARREKERAEMEERGDRSLTDEGRERGERRNESSQRGDRRGRYNSTSGGERGGRGAKREKGDSGRGESGERYNRNKRGEKGEKYDSSGQGGRGEKSGSNGRGERGDENYPPHDGCQDTTEATGWRGRRKESHEEEERASEEEGTHLHPL